VILGHVDSPTGPAVFTRLASLRVGTRLYVDRADGSVVTFQVTRVQRYLRERFPVAEVYLPTLDAELRLITCGGRYIRSRGGYQSNVVVFAAANTV
jgi:sortase (surface protein transpeptidase)